MLNKMRNSLRDHTSIFALPSLQSAAEQTRASWAKPIESYDAVPVLYRGFFEPFLATGQGFPNTVLAPSYEGFIHRTTEKLICLFNDEIYILLKNGNTFETQCYSLDGISYIEVRTILLDSHIKISGVNRQGDFISTTIRFNTVTDYLFQPILDRIRLAGAATQKAAHSLERDKFDQWNRLNYKFMNYAKRSILGEERVLHAILQPEIRASVFTVLGKTFYRTLSPTHALILTDQELILIREELRQNGEDNYGGIWDYIPLRKIIRLTIREKDGNLRVLSIQMPGRESLECFYEGSAEPEIDQFLDRYLALQGQARNDVVSPVHAVGM